MNQEEMTKRRKDQVKEKIPMELEIVSVQEGNYQKLLEVLSGLL